MILADSFAEHGPLNLARSQYLVAPLRHYQGSKTKEINFKKPTRFGGSLFVDLAYFWTIPNRPVPWLNIFQNDDIAYDHVSQRIWPSLDLMRWYDDYQPIYHSERKIKTGRHRNGMTFKYTGPSPKQLQSKGYGVVVCDEPWMYPEGTIDEAKGRLSDFRELGKDKLICVAQAGAMGSHNEWQIQFDSGVLHEWYVPCGKCSELMPLKWTGLREDRSRWGVVYKSETDPETHLRSAEAAKKSVRFECPHCGHQHRDTEALRRRWNAYGGYYHAAADGTLTHERDFAGDKISFRGTCLLTVPMERLVAEWVDALNDIDASGSFSKHNRFINKRLAEEVDDVQDTSVAILASTDGTDSTDADVPTWDQTKHICLTVDCQMDHFWAWVEAVNEAGDTMVLLAQRIETTGDIEDLQERFGLVHGLIGLDVSNHRSKWAKTIAQYGLFKGTRFHSWWALSGRSMPRGWIDYDSERNRKIRRFYQTSRLDPSDGISDPVRRKFFKRRGVPLLEFDADSFKDLTWERYKTGRMKFHPSVDTSLVGKHFQGEHRVKERGKHVWKQIGKRDQHLWDGANMATVLLSTAGYLTIGDK